MGEHDQPPAPHEPSDEEAVARLRAGDEAMLACLAHRHRRVFVASFRQRFCPPLGPADLEDAFYDALAELWSSRLQLDAARGSLRSYFYGIMRHCLLQYTRQELRRRGSEAGGVDIETLTAPATAGERDTSPRLEIVRRCLEELPEPYRTIARLDAWCYPAPTPATTVAEITGLPPQHVRVYRQRARRKLRKLLEEQGLDLDAAGPAPEESP
jgi:RNA polymerase sigma factor (sigma-70 family)